jgi:peptidoglycan/xylan/chitin deacetylase (PgdA/CDA1 family)
MDFYLMMERISRCHLVVGYYHLVRDQAPLHIKHLYPCKTPRQFERDLDFLLERHTPIDIPMLIAQLRDGKDLPKYSLLLTFDDGFREAVEIISPILLRKGVPAVFFINTAFINNKRMSNEHKKSLIIECLLAASSKQLDELFRMIKASDSSVSAVLHAINHLPDIDLAVLDRMAITLAIDFDSYLKNERPYLTKEQIASLISSGFSIGAHSIDHPRYCDIPMEEQLKQTLESTIYLKSLFGLKYGLFAFPHSDYGVTSHFFHNVRKSQHVDVTFGTRGLLDDSINNHIQRMSFEKPVVPVQRLLRRELIRRFIKKVKGTGLCLHPLL